MSNAVDIKVNPKNVIQIKEEKEMKRLEKKVERLSKILEPFCRLESILAYSSVGLLFAGLGAGRVAVEMGSPETSLAWTACTLMTVGSLASFAGTVVNGANCLAGALRVNALESKLENLKIKRDPQSYFNKILEKEQKKLEVYENFQKGSLSVKELCDPGLANLNAENFEKQLARRRKRVSVLNVAQDFIRKSSDTETILKVVKLSIDATDANIDSIQKLVLPRQETNKTTINTVQKSKSDER